MPLFVQTPKNDRIIERLGTYQRYINGLDRKETAVQRELRRAGLGSYETEVQATLLALCEESIERLVVYDIGAHIGIYSAVISTIFRGTNPYIASFEPTPDTEEITRNIRDRNNLTYQVIASAVAEHPGSLDLYLSTKAETSNSLNPNFREGSKPITVPVTTVDIFHKGGAPLPSVVKIDVETFEYAVLSGALETIIAAKPFITRELLPKADRTRTGVALSWLEYLGYKFYRIDAGNDWKPHGAKAVMKTIDHTLRDWVFSPEELPGSFFDSLANWRRALKKCDKSSNVEIDGGLAIPDKLMSKW